MTRACRWGIMATGLIADKFTTDLLTAGMTVAAVGSRDVGKSRAFADRHGIVTAHGSYDALVADTDVDAIYVATPHPFHLECARLALNAGKHVLIEKPIAMNAAQTREITTLAREKGLLVMEAMWTRFLPHMARLRERIADGTLGDIRCIRADHGQALPEDPSHRLNAMELGGGALLDLGIYPVSLACELLGPVTDLRTLARFKSTGADAAVEILMQHESGVSQLSCASDLHGPNTACIIGTRARVDIDAIWYAPTRMRIIASDGTLIEEFDGTCTGRGMQFQARAFEAAIAAGLTEVPEMTPQASVAVMQVMDRIRADMGLRYDADAEGAS